MHSKRYVCDRCEATEIRDVPDREWSWVSLGLSEEMRLLGEEFPKVDLCGDCTESFMIWLAFTRLEEHDLEAFKAANELGEYSE